MNKYFEIFWMFAPMVAFLPTWWAAFRSKDISALTKSQWWIFTVSNMVILSKIENPVPELLLLYWAWTAMTATMQLAIWFRLLKDNKRFLLAGIFLAPEFWKKIFLEEVKSERK